MERYTQTNPLWTQRGAGDRIRRAFEEGNREAREQVLNELPAFTGSFVVRALTAIASGSGLGGAQIPAAIEMASHLTAPERVESTRARAYLHLAFLTASIGHWSAAQQYFRQASVLNPSGTLVAHALLTATPFTDRSREEIMAIRDSVASWDGVLADAPHVGLFEVPSVLRPHVRRYLLGLLEGRLGHDDIANRLADSIESHVPSEHLITDSDRSTFLHDFALEVRAAAAFGRDDPAGALELLERMKLAVTWWDMQGSVFNRRWYGWFLRAELLSAAGRGEEANRWYANFSYPVSPDYVFIPCSFYRRGQIFDRAGVADSAIAYYERFLELWAAADTEFAPVLANANQRLEALLRTR